MATQANIEQIAKFRKDARFLLTLYSNSGMDEALGFKGNFSGYVNGHKKPSAEKIHKFYEIYGKDLQRFDRQLPEKPDQIGDIPPAFPGFLAELKEIRYNLSLIKDLLTSRQHQQDLAELNAKLDKIERRLSKDDPSGT